MSSPKIRRTISKSLTRPLWGTSVRARDRLWLDKNENMDPALSLVIQDVVQHLPGYAFSTYPEMGVLYDKLARFLDVKADNLLVSAGSDGVIRSAFEAFVEPGDVVLYTGPTFAMYEVYCKIYGAVELVQEYMPSAKGLQLDMEAFLTLISARKPRMVCLPNPNSPTGTVISEAEMQSLLDSTHEVGSLLMIDEAYYPFYEKTVMSYIGKYDNLLVIRSTGKAWGMAGFRIGFGVADAKLAEAMHKVRPMYEANTVGVMVLGEMIDRYDEVLKSVGRLNEGKQAFLAFADRHGFNWFPTQGNFVHIGFGSYADRIDAALQDCVYYRRATNHPSLEGFSRFSLAPLEAMQRIMNTIEGELNGK